MAHVYKPVSGSHQTLTTLTSSSWTSRRGCSVLLRQPELTETEEEENPLLSDLTLGSLEHRIPDRQDSPSQHGLQRAAEEVLQKGLQHRPAPDGLCYPHSPPPRPLGVKRSPAGPWQEGLVTGMWAGCAPILSGLPQPLCSCDTCSWGPGPGEC
jgi:hypothetical protein